MLSLNASRGNVAGVCCLSLSFIAIFMGPLLVADYERSQCPTVEAVAGQGLSDTGKAPCLTPTIQRHPQLQYVQYNPFVSMFDRAQSPILRIHINCSSGWNQMQSDVDNIQCGVVSKCLFSPLVQYVSVLGRWKTPAGEHPLFCRAASQGSLL